MLKADSNGTEVLGNRFCYGINLIKGRASPCQSSSNFVNEDCTSKTAGC